MFLLLVGCGHKRFYDGPVLHPTQVAVIAKRYGPGDNDAVLQQIRFATGQTEKLASDHNEVLPGRVRFSAIMGARAPLLRLSMAIFEFDARAGHTYLVRGRRNGGVFYVEDEPGGAVIHPIEVR